MSKFQDLLVQIEQFIRKYYKNEMIKGAFLFFIIFLLSFLFVTTLEYFGRFSPSVRTLLFFAFIISNGFVAVKYIIIPLLRLAKVSDRLTLNQASRMIGDLFPDVSDKLQNTLQLNAQLNDSNSNIDLLKASIQQKASSLSAIPFTTGIQIGENRKYLKYLLPVVLLIAAIFLLRPGIFRDGSNRILNYSQEFVIKAPFDFILESKDKLMQGETYELVIKLKGEQIPSELKIVSNNGTYNLKKESPVEFVHTFRNLDEDLNFYCIANGYKSLEFNIDVIEKPSLDDVFIKLKYPRHMKMASETISDLSDISVPEGTLMEWNVTSENVTQVKGQFEDTTMIVGKNTGNQFVFKKIVRKPEVYSLLLSTNEVKDADTLVNNISVIPDAYPTIVVNEYLDSLNPFVRFIDGSITDDFGFSGLRLTARIFRADSVELINQRIKINPNQSKQLFGYSLNIKDFNLNPGDEVEYFFSVSDNDAPNGYKSTVSSKLVYSVPELTDLDNVLSEKSDNLKNDMDKALDEAKEIKQEISQIKNDLINKTTADWKDKQSISNMLQKQENLQMKLENLQQQFEDNSQEENEFLDNSEELLEKQEMLEKLMEELLDEEMKSLLEELQKLMDELNKDEILENMERMERKSGDLEKELDRTLELFKHLELDKKIESIEVQLRELSDEQDALKEDTESKKVPLEELEKRQEELNEKFEEIKDDIEQAEEMNEALEKPKDLDFDKNAEDEIQKEMGDAKEQLGDGKKKKASGSQEKAADMMKQMADDISAMMDGASGQQQTEDMDKLRFLLENVVNLSHQQEDLMKSYANVKRSNPVIVDYNREQLKIIQSTEIVRDSLMSLAKRHGQLSNTIIEELNDLEYNQDKAKAYGQERNLSKVKQHQQYAVTAYNDLALLLASVLEQMQNQMKSQMPGSGSCDKPGGNGQGKPSSGQMSMEQMKQQLKKQMNQMKNGNSPGGKDGKKPGSGEGMGGLGNGSIPGLGPKEIAKMALEQAQMRKALQQLRQELNKDGSGTGNGLNKLIEDMKNLENDLLKDGYTNNIYKRQQDILTRLLESEKALMERGFSDERESKSGKNTDDGNQIELLEYNRKKESEIELLRTVPIGLRVYYKNMVNSYFNTVNK